MQAAWKVGLLVVVFVGLLLATYAVLERSFFAKPTVSYFIEFEDAGGLNSGSQVLLSGVQIGSVKGVELVSSRLARVEIAINEGFEIPAGSTAVLPTSFISIGDRRVEIVPPIEDVVAFLSPGDTIPGSVTSPMQNFMPESEETLKELNATLVAFRELLEDEGMRSGVTDLMTASEKTITDFGLLANRMDSMIAQNADSFDALLMTTATSLENLEAISLVVRDMVESGELEEKTLALLDNMNAAVVSGQELVAELTAVATDPDMRRAIDETLANVKTMSESGTRIAESAEVMAENGVVVSDEAVKLARKANKLADDVADLLQEFRETLGSLASGGKSLAEGLEVTADITRETDPGRFRSDVNFTFPMGEERLTFGMYDAFESNKLNLQIGKDFNSRTAFRYGVYASKPSLGVDYSLAPRLNLRGDLFGLNEPQLDLRFKYDFNPGIYGWFGVERVFQKPMAAVGFGIKR